MSSSVSGAPRVGGKRHMVDAAAAARAAMKQAVQVLDEDGNDVTPQMLFQPKANVFRNEKEAKLFQSMESTATGSSKTIQVGVVGVVVV